MCSHVATRWLQKFHPFPSASAASWSHVFGCTFFTAVACWMHLAIHSSFFLVGLQPAQPPSKERYNIGLKWEKHDKVEELCELEFDKMSWIILQLKGIPLGLQEDLGTIF